jgi:hypothetical protein
MRKKKVGTRLGLIGRNDEKGWRIQAGKKKSPLL